MSYIAPGGPTVNLLVGGAAPSASNPLPTTVTSNTGVEANQLDLDRVTVAVGDAPTRMALYKFGRRAAVGTSYVDIAVQGTVVQPAAASKVYLWSTSGDDVLGGANLEKVQIYGLGEAGALQDELLDMNGTTEVESAGTYTAVFRIKPVQAASVDSPAGTVNVGATGKGTTYARIPIYTAVGRGQTQMAWYQVPTGYKLVIDEAGGSVVDTSKAGALNLLALDVGSCWRSIWERTLTPASSSTALALSGPYAAGTVIKIQGKIASTSGDMFAFFSGYLVPV